MSADERVEAAAKVLREVMLREEWADSYDLIIEGHQRKGVDPAACNDGACRRARIYAEKYAAAILASGVVAQPATVERTYDERDNAGPWIHDDGTHCASHWSDRPAPEQGGRWWCTEHQQHVHTATPARDGLAEAVRGLLERAESGADAWGACSHEWLRIAELRAILAEHGATS